MRNVHIILVGNLET